jgi:hypothetical protein
MTILLPLGLAALVALPIVLLLHMRNTTPRLRPVPTLRFWLAAEPERTEQARFRRPPLTWLLLLHLLIAGALGLALARPVAGQALEALGLGGLAALRTEPRHLILLLDGSTSMAAVDTATGRTRFEEARERVGQRLADLREGDVATVLLLGTRVATLGATDAASLGALRERVAALPLPGGRADLDGALGLSRDLLLPEMENRVAVVTDGAVMADPGSVADLGAAVELVLIGSAADGRAAPNVGVVDVAVRPVPGSPDQLRLFGRVMNFSPQAVTAPVVLTGAGVEIAREEISLPGNGGSEELSWPLPPGVTEATVRVEGQDPLAADDTASLILRQDEAAGLTLRILLVSDAPADLQRALAALPGAEVRTELSGAFGDALAGQRYDLIVFEKTAPPPDVIEGLGTPLLFVNPPPGGPFPSEATMLDPTVSRLRAQDPLLTGVDLAGATFGATPIYPLSAGQTEVVGGAEGPLVVRGEVAGQPVLLFAFDLAASNLPRRVAFPILVANAVAELAPSPLPNAVPLGDPLRYRPRAGAVTVRVAPPEGEPVDLRVPDPGTGETPAADAGGAGSVPPEAAAALPDALREVAFTDTGRPGAYNVRELDVAGAELGGGRFVVNAGHPRESDLRPTVELADALAGGAPDAVTTGRLDDAVALWPLLAALAFVLLAVEWLVALVPRSRQRSAISRQPSAGG